MSVVKTAVCETDLGYRARLITTIIILALTQSATKLAAEHYQDLFADVQLPKHELLEIHHRKISFHHAKAGYSYPTVRLPYMFSKLVGLPTRVCQTVYDGALAFLVVLSKSLPAEKNAEISGNAQINAYVRFYCCKFSSKRTLQERFLILSF